MPADLKAHAAPRLLFACASTLVDPAARSDVLTDAKRFGFSAILLGCPFPQYLRDGGHDLSLLGDVTELLVGDASGALLSDLTSLALQCHREGLELVLDIALERAIERGGMTAALLPWMPARDRALNPRASDFGRPGAPMPWYEEQAGQALVEHYVMLMQRLSHAGIDGFRLIGLSSAPVERIAALVAGIIDGHTPGPCALYAETEGVPSGLVEQLSALPFSGAIASLPWWDLRATWFYEEHQRIARFGRVLMPVASAHLDQAPVDDTSARRLLVAAGLGDGMIVPLELLEMARADAELASLLVNATATMTGPAHLQPGRLRLVSAPDRPITVVARQVEGDTTLVAINSSGEPQSMPVAALATQLAEPPAQLTTLTFANQHAAPAATVGGQLVLNPYQVSFLKPQVLAPVLLPEPTRQGARRTLDQAIAAPRVAIEAVGPSVDDGRFAVRADAGSTLAVEADVFCDGHDLLAVRVQWRALDQAEWHEAAMTLLVNDRYQGHIVLDRMGRYEFRVAAFVDRFGSWLKDTGKKRAAALDLTLEVQEGCLMVEAFAAHSTNKALHALLLDLKKARRNSTQAFTFRLDALFNPATRVLMDDADPRLHVSVSPIYPVQAERRAAHFSGWYELFPRSMSPEPGRHGTLKDVIAHLPRIAGMGFDVLYFPPIHPIGLAHRKGRNNSLTASATDPGSPYAIGSPDGGHDALHPELGTLEDFTSLVAHAHAHGLELALDFAVQCSPDHPWLKQHPEWFSFRPDGSLRYAENPPKKYEDIVNVDFYTDRAEGRDKTPAASLWMALRDAVMFWVVRGVRIFRVDNPHTKPLPFWEWMIGDITARHPDVLFLAEAFTTPKMMARLAKVGFTQSYSYFTWRNTKLELSTYMLDLASPPLSYVYRPNFFVNTPDINPRFLQTSGRAGFLIRAALAALLSGLWGVYSGFELLESEAVAGKEEYFDSEKYQLRQRDFTAPGNIIAEITRLNLIRHTNPAFASHLNVTFYQASDENILYFGKATANRDNVVLVAINLDPRSARECEIEIPMWEFNLADDQSLVVDDLVEGHHFSWHGKRQRVRIDPAHRPYLVWRVAAPHA